MTSTKEQFGERLSEGFFGPDNPVVSGTRWSRYPRGYRWVDRSLPPGQGPIGRLFDGAPPLNPFTGRPFEGAIISCPRDRDVRFPAGAIVQVTTGDSGGGESFRRFMVGPGTPVSLRLGQYQSVRVLIEGVAAVPGAVPLFPTRLQWVDQLPSLPDSGLLRAPPQLFVAGVAPPNANIVPDGAVQLIVGDVGGAAGNVNISFAEYTTNPGLPTRFRLSGVSTLDTIRTSGVEFICNLSFQGQFLLAGL